MSSPHPSADLLMQHALGDLAPVEVEQLELHLRGCESCAEDFHALGKLLWQYQRSPAPPPPARLLPRLLGEQAANRRPVRMRRLFGTGLAWAAIFVAGFFFGRERAPLPPPPGEAATLQRAPLPKPPTLKFHHAVLRDAAWRDDEGLGEAASWGRRDEVDGL